MHVSSSAGRLEVTGHERKAEHSPQRERPGQRYTWHRPQTKTVLRLGRLVETVGEQRGWPGQTTRGFSLPDKTSFLLCGREAFWGIFDGERTRQMCCLEG